MSRRIRSAGREIKSTNVDLVPSPRPDTILGIMASRITDFSICRARTVMWSYIYGIGTAFMSLICSVATEQETSEILERNRVGDGYVAFYNQRARYGSAYSCPEPDYESIVNLDSIHLTLPRYYSATLAISADMVMSPSAARHLYVRPTDSSSSHWSFRITPREQYFTVSESKIKIRRMEFFLEPYSFEFPTLPDDWLVAWTPIEDLDTSLQDALTTPMNWMAAIRRSNHRASGRNASSLAIRWDVPNPTWQPYGQEIEVSRLYGTLPPIGANRSGGNIAIPSEIHSTETPWSYERTGYGSKILGVIRIVHRASGSDPLTHPSEVADLLGQKCVATLRTQFDFELTRPNFERYPVWKSTDPPLGARETRRVRVVKARVNEHDPDSDAARKYGFWNVEVMSFNLDRPQAVV